MADSCMVGITNRDTGSIGVQGDGGAAIAGRDLGEGAVALV